MKRPILGFLAAVLVSAGFVGSSPARAATPDSNPAGANTAAAATPAHGGGDDHDRDGYKYSHPHGGGAPGRRHPRHGGGHDDGHGAGNDDGHDRRRRCEGLIVICLG